MPPKPKCTREQIIAAALEITAQQGAQALTAKELGRALQTSTTPIFTVFRSMQEVQSAVREAAMARFEAYAHRTAPELPPFKQVGIQMILFAKEQPRLYQLIFMSPNQGVTRFESILPLLGGVADECLAALCRDYGLTDAQARELFEHCWIHTFGIGVLCATETCDFSFEQISAMLTQDFTAMLALLRSGDSQKT